MTEGSPDMVMVPQGPGKYNIRIIVSVKRNIRIKKGDM